VTEGPVTEEMSQSVGAGGGRHALVLGEHGLAVKALDGTAKGLAVVRESARAHGLSLGVRRGTADALPFDDGSFDFALSWNVIHHGHWAMSGAASPRSGAC
jgi:tellurite methyltransferase